MADRGDNGLHWALNFDYDVIVLDIMLPGKDGLTICQELRDQRINTPVLMLTHTARRGDHLVDFSTKEYALLEFLMRHPNQVLSRTLIADHLWSYAYAPSSNVVDVYIRFLHKKIDDEYAEKYIRLTIKSDRHTILAVVFLILSFALPITGLPSSVDRATIFALEGMHIVTGVAIVGALTKLGRQA